MNQNILIGTIVLIVLLVGGYFLFTMQGSPLGTIATSTSATTTDTDTGNDTNPAATPSAPAVITDASVAPTNSTAVVTGKVTPNGSPTTYWYEYGATAALGSKTASQSIGSGWSAIPSPGYITGLRANTSYFFRLSARNSLGTTNGTTQTFSTNNNPPGQGTAPAASTNAGTNVTRTSATLNAHVNPHSSATTYWFEYGTDANFGSVTAFTSAGSGDASLAVSAPLNGLAPQTKYFFRVNAQNQYGTVNGATQNFTTPGPAISLAPVVTTQVASAVAATTATVRGTVNSSAPASYWFEYGTEAGLASGTKTTAHKTVVGTATVSIEAAINGLKSGTTYYYRTVAQNAANTARGDILSFQTK